MTAFTNLIYSEFDTTQANLLADIRTAILSSASWSRPNSGSKPSTYKATTTRGAQMVFDLEDAAISTFAMTIGVYTSYDGTTFGDKTQRYLYWRNSGGATTNTLHCIVSASKEHIFISVEGPRGSETGAESVSLGSTKQSFFMCDVVPYHAGDTTPVVFCGGNNFASYQANSSISPLGHFSRNYANNASWAVTRMLTLTYLVNGGNASMNVTRQTVGDGKYYLAPFVGFSDTDGLRGRLAAFFYAGHIIPDLTPGDTPTPPVGSKVTYDGNTYKFLTLVRTSQNGSMATPLGWVFTNSGDPRNIAIAIPCT